LANAKEDVLEFLIVLFSWTSLLEFATNDANMGHQESGQIILQATNLGDPNINVHLNQLSQLTSCFNLQKPCDTFIIKRLPIRTLNQQMFLFCNLREQNFKVLDDICM